MKHLVLLFLFACSSRTSVVIDGGHDEDAPPLPIDPEESRR